jgi:virginiamycin A acetyltransferase
VSARKTIKRVLRLFSLIIACPFYLWLGLTSLGGNRDSTFQHVSQLLSLFPGKTGIYIRAAFYHLACSETSDEISVGFLTLLSHRDTTIEKGVYIGPQCNIGKCTISENTLIGSGVHILSGSNQHNFDWLDKPIQEQGGHYEKIQIGQDCWIGNGSIIMKNIADQSIVAAASLVIEEFPARSIIGGHPAKVIKNR